MSIQLSPKYGVNPSMIVCAFCEEVVEAALLGKLSYERAKRLFPNITFHEHGDDVKAPKKFCASVVPCEKCREKGIFFLEANGDDPATAGWTGAYVIMKKEAVPEFLCSPEHVKQVLERGVGYLSKDAWEALKKLSSV